MVRVKDDRGGIIFGVGLDAVKCVYLLENLGRDFSFFVTNHKKQDFFMGKPVYAAEEVKGDFFYIIAVSYHTYPIIAKQMRNAGKREFEDFIYYEWMNKEIVFLHGNCHLSIVQQYMESSKDFCNQYTIYQCSRLVSNAEFCFEKEFFDHIRVWIHQDIRKDNRMGYHVSDEYIRSCISDISSITEIIVPNLYGHGRGFFPQNKGMEHNSHNEAIANMNGTDLNGMFCTPDFVIEDCMKRNLTIEETMDWCNRDDLFDAAEIIEAFEKMISRIKEREKKWDIPISQFIIDHYKHKKLFFDAFHPTNVILKYISEKILDLLNCGYEEIGCLHCLDAHEEPVYPSVSKILELEWKDEEIRKSKRAKKALETMSFNEYIKEYAWWCK